MNLIKERLIINSKIEYIESSNIGTTPYYTYSTIDVYYVACKPIIRSSLVYIYWNELLFIVIIVWCLQ